MNGFTLNEVLNTETFNKEIAKKIQNARKIADITQDEMATSMGGSKNHISALERGVNKITLQAFLVYCVKCGKSPNEILGWASEEEKPKKVAPLVPAHIMSYADNIIYKDEETGNAMEIEIKKNQAKKSPMLEGGDSKPLFSVDFLMSVMNLPEDERKKMIDLLHFAKESDNK